MWPAEWWIRDTVLLTKARKASEGLFKQTMPQWKIKSKSPPSSGLKTSLPAGWTVGGSHGALGAPFCLGLQRSGTKLHVSSRLSLHLALSFYNLEVSLIDRGPELCVLAYFRDSVTSPFLYFVLFLLVGLEPPLVEF